MKYLISLVALFALTGCAGINIDKKTGEASSYGVFRTMTISYYRDGKVKAVSTDSTTKDLLLGLDKIVDSAFNTATKAIP